MQLRIKPKECALCLGCTKTPSSTGFVPADLRIPIDLIKFAIMAEAAGEQEVIQGIPLCGATGTQLRERIMKPLNLTREDVLWDNLLRCRPYKNDFPEGARGVEMIQMCRQWDTMMSLWNPNVVILAFHPTAALIHTNQAYSTMNAVKKALALRARGYRPLIGMGRHFLETFFPGLPGTISRWDGKHFFVDWRSEGIQPGPEYLRAIDDIQEPERISPQPLPSQLSGLTQDHYYEQRRTARPRTPAKALAEQDSSRRLY